MALLLAKKLSHSFQLSTPHLCITLLPFLRLSTAADQPKDPKFMTQYLITSFGFSPDRALKVASGPILSAVKTHDRPQAVLGFLKETGLTDSQIKSLISWNPQLLGYSVSNSLEPRVSKLVAAGFTGETLTRLIQTCPHVLLSNPALSRLQYWRDFAGNDEVLLNILRKNYRLLQLDIDEVVLPTISQLKDSGFPDADIRKLYVAIGDDLKGPDFVKKLIEDTEALGFDRKSRMFIAGLIVIGKHNRDTIERKFQFFRNNYGWSDDEVRAAFKRFPSIVSLSEKTLKLKIDFLTGRVGLKNEDIVSIPEFLGYNVEKRFLPRHHVLSLLKLKDLNRVSLRSVVWMSDSDFFDKFVKPYRNQIPELEEFFPASCEGKISI